MARPVLHVVVGPEQHGVVRYALRVHAELHRLGVDDPLLRAEDVGAAAADLPRALDGCGLVHAHVTDRLFGRPADVAADRVVALARTAEELGAPLSVTLHDLPQASDGDWAQRRRAAYADIAAAAIGVVVTSEHERRLLRAVTDRATVSVVPHLVDPPLPPATDDLRPEVAVLGYLYPGKGHVETVRALAGLPADVGFLALGRPSDGHADLVDEVRAACAVQGRPFELTGFLTDDELTARARQVAVPVCHHRHVSASGSLVAWVEAGRRPLVPQTAYTRELLDRSPGTLTTYPDTEAGLRSAIDAALADPASTWLGPDVRPRPTPPEVATAYAAQLAAWSR